MKYALLTGFLLWVSWFVDISLGYANYDLAGNDLGGDYMRSYGGGMTIVRGESKYLYNQDYQKQLQAVFLGHERKYPITNYAAFTPPHYMVLFIPFSLLPFRVSFALWSLLGFSFLYLSIKLSGMEKPRQTFWFALTWLPVLADISFGQNGLLSLALFSLTYALWSKDVGNKRGNLFIAGIVASLLFYKPQLVIGLGLLWVLNLKRDWPALIGLGLGAIVQAGLSFWLMPQASLEYFFIAKDVLPTMLQKPEFPIWYAHNLRAFWLLLIPGNSGIAEGLGALSSLAGIPVFIKLNRDLQSKPALRFAGAVILTVWLSPHFMIYEWSIFLLPALLLWQTLPEQRKMLQTLYALLWIAMLLSASLTVLQLQAAMPFAIQISIPVLLLVCYYLLALMKNMIIADQSSYLD